MAAGVMHVYVNNECIRVHGGNMSDIRHLTNWYNNSPYEVLVKKHVWLKPNDIIKATKYKK